LRPRVEIVVDELVVRGLRPTEARSAADAFEAHLAQLAAGEAPVAERTESFRAAPAIQAGSDELGKAVAGAVWSEISGSARR
jgi:hypothetical protein